MGIRKTYITYYYLYNDTRRAIRLFKLLLRSIRGYMDFEYIVHKEVANNFLLILTFFRICTVRTKAISHSIYNFCAQKTKDKGQRICNI